MLNNLLNVPTKSAVKVAVADKKFKLTYVISDETSRLDL